ncbi:MAG TPA: SAM-dependent chlorinase/fluorinase [Acidimicrobiia bacterium]|nr:SAM-dependent chlorinase/fluorinase [Acidimicrobiia bacterium]
MTLARRFVSFLSDYGHSDEFVGVCKSVMLSLAPDLQIIDITHDLPVHDVRAGALTLVRAAQYLPDGGIVLAVVDPGVGTDRRLVAVEVEHGILLGPDNGLLAPAVAILGGAQRVVSLTSTEHQLPAPGPTFAGRDVLAPAAAHLAAGVDPSELGDEVDAAGLVPGLVSLPQHDEGGAIHGEVWWIDRFGNCQLNIDPDELRAHGAEPGAPIEVRFGEQARSVRWVHTYADAKPSELVLLVDSYGLASLALDRGSAAAECALAPGSAVTLVPPGATVSGRDQEPS